MHWIEYIGFIGAGLTAITFIPQVVKAWQTKSVGDLSASTVAIVIISACVWLFYALYLHLLSIIIANSLVLVSSVILVIFKWKFKPLTSADSANSLKPNP